MSSRLPSSCLAPGHGDVYDTLLQSDAYRTLMEEGKTILFVSNGDNLGATVDLRILNMMHQESELEFFCEVLAFLSALFFFGVLLFPIFPPSHSVSRTFFQVVAKTLRDVKGGTIIEYDNRLKLLELAQVPADKARVT